MDYKTFTTDFGGRELKVETGKFAQQANGSVVLTYGKTVVLATAVMSKEQRDKDFFPLMVDYDERMYAVGRIKGSRFIKREGRPVDEAILTSRLIDRAIRPVFDQKIRNEIQIVATVLSFDEENDPDIISLIAASLALHISDIPWDGPLGAARVSLDKNNNWILNPSYEQRENSSLDITIAGKDKVNMIETAAMEIDEDTIVAAVEFGSKEIEKIIAFQEKIKQEVGKEKEEVGLPESDKDLKKSVQGFVKDKLNEILFSHSKAERMGGLDEIRKLLAEKITAEYGDDKLNQSWQLLDEEVDQIIHNDILKHNKRVDGRKLDEIRPLKIEVAVLPKTHGSGIFQRGETQALSVVTLAGPKSEQYLDSMELTGKKHYFHHYNFLPFSTGEIGRIGAPGRREIGHGALAEKALMPVLPSREIFPYTIRVVSEILSSNGSSSMASTCGSTLALLDAGVPIRANVAGIAMGLMMRGEDYKILTDIQGPEDHHGDMDLKVAGTRKGVTAMQMDVKIEGITLEILKDALIQAKKARLLILDEMEKVIKEPREELSPYAPHIYSLQIHPSKIGMVIGPGGRTINDIINTTGVESIDIEEDGRIFIVSQNGQGNVEKALERIKGLTHEVAIGEIFKGRVVKVAEFGAFVEILPGQEGLVHISELAPYRVKKTEDIVKRGDEVMVKVIRIDDNGKVALSMKQANG